jgi:hypothetical protein
VPPAQVVTTFTGELLSASHIADDERDRAVEAIVEASTAAPRFDRVIPIESLDGFHGEGDPPEVVVGNPEPSFVRLVGARGSLVESLTPDVVRVSDPFRPGQKVVVATSDSMLLQLHPGLPGPGEVVARLPGTPRAAANRLALIRDDERRVLFRREKLSKLDVMNLLPRIVSLSFHYVKSAPDNSDGVVTARTPNAAFEQLVVGKMNEIYAPQTKIRFFRASQRVVRTIFSGPVTVSSHGTIGSAAFTTNIDTSTQLRIFFVGMIAPSDGKDIFASSEGHPGRNILCRDSLNPGGGPVFEDAGAVGIVLAHECGHNFGVKEHPDPNPRHLMHAENEGVIIPLLTAELMNKGAVPGK